MPAGLAYCNTLSHAPCVYGAYGTFSLSLVSAGHDLEIWKFRYMDFGIFICSKIMEFDLKWVHMARYELILKLDGAIWRRIIFKPLLTQKGLYKLKNNLKYMKQL